MINLILLLIFVILQILDIYTTRKILLSGGRELNPVMNFIMLKLGVDPGLILAKVIIVVFVCSLILFVNIDHIIFGLVNLGYALVIINNFNVLKKLNK